MTVKVYGFDRTLVADATVHDDFTIEFVRKSDYAALKAKMDMVHGLMSVDEQVNALVKENVETLAAERDELKQKCDALAVENAALKSGSAFFSYGSEHHFEWHKSAKEAIEAAEAAIDDYRGDACDGWSEEVDSVCWGVIMQSSTKVGERPRTDEDHCDPAIDTICDYALLPNIETPATDAALAEVRNEAQIEICESLIEIFRRCSDPGKPFSEGAAGALAIIDMKLEELRKESV